MDDLFDILAQYEQEESGQGGIIALTEVSSGYKVYAKGHEQQDTWFGFPAGDEETKAKAMAEAKKFAAENDASEPQFGIQIRCNADNALSRGVPVTWAADRFFNTAIWTQATKEVVLPSLKKSNIGKLPWLGWARIGFQSDPFKVAQGEDGMTGEDVEGNPRYPQVAYIVEVFKSETEAKANIDIDDAMMDTGNEWIPDGEDWTAESLEESAESIINELEDKDAATVAEEYGLSVQDVLIAAGVHKTTGGPKKEADKYGVKPGDVTAARNLKDSIPF